mmetsp:Transcript_41669/g.100225  ORF Transcript_41669/g.100225 Transcript_41669/m.100225 type:complete len:240 (-) Transcript_41669:615-1334(-)
MYSCAVLSVRHGGRSVMSSPFCSARTVPSRESSSCASSLTHSESRQLVSHSARPPSGLSQLLCARRSPSLSPSSRSSSSPRSPATPSWCTATRSRFCSNMLWYLGCSSSVETVPPASACSRWASMARCASSSSRSSWSPSASCTTWKSAPSPASSSAGRYFVILPVLGPTLGNIRSTCCPTHSWPLSSQPSLLLMAMSATIVLLKTGCSSLSAHFSRASPACPRPSSESMRMATCAAVS